MGKNRYDILFEPVPIGPVTAPNRFYQVPHCNGFGHRHPQAEAANRAIKAEGGWGVVCTQEVEIHPSSEISPAFEGRIWDEQDVESLRLMTDAVHSHGALAGIELVYNGSHAPNRYSRIAPLAPSPIAIEYHDPIQARGMTLKDIKDVRRWYVNAAKLSRDAGFDIVYVYAGHNMTLLQHFLVPRYNRRTDDYGGSLENRVRLLKETLTDVKNAIGDTCAVALRFAVDELMSDGGITADGEGREIVTMLAEIPDLWDVNISDWSNDSATARFEPNEGFQDEYIAFVKSVTDKPVVGVGRYTSPDAMVSRVEKGMLDFIGAARPSIADPFLPMKVKEGRIDEIRECIGCNICVSCDNLGMPIRCTQNPTMGQEWKQNWHPETIEVAHARESVLVVGGGPAGLECALQLGLRGYRVMLAEARLELGGRALLESRLPGLSSYSRVIDYRVSALRQMSNVSIYLDNKLSVDDILTMDVEHLVIATGSKWRKDGMGREHLLGIPVNACKTNLITPDEIMAGTKISGRVLIYDDDHYYMGGVLAEHLANQGCEVCLVTPAPLASAWTEHTLELAKIQRRLNQLSVSLNPLRRLVSLSENVIHTEGVYSGRQEEFTHGTLCLVTSRESDDSLLSLHDEEKFESVRVIGDARAPSTIAEAIYGGHLAARQIGQTGDEYQYLYRRELTNTR